MTTYLFKTKNTDWVGTKDPVIIPISIYSAFHASVGPNLKMSTLISSIKKNVHGTVTIFFTEEAHLQAMKLEDSDAALEKCRSRAQELALHYESDFKGCQILYWHSLVGADGQFELLKAQLKELSQKDASFQQRLEADAVGTYTQERQRKIPQREKYIEATIEDILGQCACILLMGKRGYRFLFYPGASYTSIEYIEQLPFPNGKKTRWIRVFLYPKPQ